jgi:dihydroorotate dehydrogenase
MIKLPRLEISDLDQKTKSLYEKYFQILLDYKVDGLVLSNTFPVEDSILKTGKGGLSGKPLYHNTKNLVSFASQFFNGELDIVASGGISTSDEVKELIYEGAKGIQLWTSLIYEGPNLIKRLNKELSCE